MSESRLTESPLSAYLRADLGDGALDVIRTMAARLQRAPSFSTRVKRGLRRALRNGWRLHLYPSSCLRGFRDRRPGWTPAAEIKRLIEEKRYDQASVLAAALLPVHDGEEEFLRAARQAFSKVGAISLQAEAAAALRLVADSPRLARQERILLGRIRETEPDWLPRLPDEAPSQVHPDPNRVLHVLKASMPHRQSGYTMRSQYLIDGQRKAGLDPVAVTALGFPRNIGAAEFPAVGHLGGTPYHRLDTADDEILSGPPDAYLEAYAGRLAQLIPEIAPSLLHVHSGHCGFEPALVGLAVAARFGLPLVYEVRGFFESLWSGDPDWNERGELYERRHATDTRCMRQADAVVTLSESMRAEMAERGVPDDKIFVVPNGVDVERFHPAPRNAELSARLGLTDRFTFGYVSNLDHSREGQETLIRAAARLNRQGLAAVALIIGDGKRRPELEAIAEAETAQDVVRFTGQVGHHEVLDYYRLLDVFVVPRVPERAARLVTPLKPFEAMAAEIPVVVSDLPSLNEIIGDGERGRSFPAGDVDSLADLLAELSADPGLRSRLAKQGRDWVLAERQWSSIANRYTAVYEMARSG